VKPPASTNYKMVDSQIELPDSIGKRAGIQPVVRLSANGRERAEVMIGTPVTFSAVVEVPSNTGKVVAAEWDFEGRGNYPVVEQLGDLKLTLKTTQTLKPHTHSLSPVLTSRCFASHHNEKAIRKLPMPGSRTSAACGLW
jgi:hypothetical protein